MSRTISLFSLLFTGAVLAAAPPATPATPPATTPVTTAPAAAPAAPPAVPPAAAKPSLAPGMYAQFYTAKGKIVTTLESEKTPMTVINFVGLAEGTKESNKPKGTRFYDGLTFHRVVQSFMIQGGDPQGSGTGGPGYQFPDEIDTTLKHDRPGVLSMANAGPGTNGSQFFITHVPTPHLDGKHTIFGHVIEGQEVVNAVVQGTILDSLRILRVGPKAKKFKADEAAFQGAMKKISMADEQKKKKEEKMLQDLLKKAVTTPSGLKYVVVKKGSGPKPTSGASIKAHYTGKLTDGKVFDSSRNRGQPLEFKVGTGMVIPGWDEALLDMTKGEQRTLIIPPNLAYGESGRPPVIPPSATLVFDVELVDF